MKESELKIFEKCFGFVLTPLEAQQFEAFLR